MKYNTCNNCNGKGSYEILNAYDLDYCKKITCETCKGKGKVAAKSNAVFKHCASLWN